MEQKAIQCKNLLVSIILITVGSASQKCKPEKIWGTEVASAIYKIYGEFESER